MDLTDIARENAVLKAVLNLTDEAVHIIDGDGITCFYNRVSAEMEGMEPDEVLGKHILEVYPSLTLESSSLLKVLQTGEPVLNQQQTLINRKGRAVTMSYSTYPLFYRNRIEGACDISRDITRIKELERLLKAAGLLGMRTVTVKKGYRTGASVRRPLHLQRSYRRGPGDDRAEGFRAAGGGQQLAGSCFWGDRHRKELLIQAIHNAGPTAAPFIAQNCAALPATLLESILSGRLRKSPGSRPPGPLHG